MSECIATSFASAISFKKNQKYSAKILYTRNAENCHNILQSTAVKNLPVYFPTYIAFLQIYTCPSHLDFIKINAQFPNIMPLIVLKLTLRKQTQVPKHSMLKMYFKVVLLMATTNKI